MREQPWHKRNASTEHYRLYQNILDLHELTLEWLKQVSVDKPSSFIKKTTNPALVQTLFSLENLLDRFNTDATLDSALDDTSPNDLLSRLEYLVSVIQAWSLTSLLASVTKDEVPALLNQLEQASWKAGRACALDRWPSKQSNNLTNLSEVLLALKDTPIIERRPTRGCLVKRATENELWLELLDCPHKSPFVEVREAADKICCLYTHWIRGFAYRFNTKIVIEHKMNDSGSPKNCEQIWLLNQ